MNEYTYTYPNESFSGCDMVATILVPDVNDSNKKNIYTIGELQTISYSIHMERKSVRSIGNINAKDYVLGPRTIAGSLVFTVFNRHFAKNIMQDISNSLESSYAFLADEIPPFDIVMSFANEYGIRGRLVIYGVRLVNEGQVMSVNDIYTENTYQFVATDIDYLDNENGYISNSTTNGKRYLINNESGIATFESEANSKRATVTFYESVYLSYKKISDASKGINGSVQLILAPQKDYGIIEIRSTDFSMDLNLTTSNIDKKYIVVSLPPGRYTARWYSNEVNSNSVNFTVNYNAEVGAIKYPAPIIEFLTENYCDILTNTTEHTHLIYRKKYEDTLFKIKLAAKRVRLEKLESDTEYEIASCNEDEASVSEFVTVRTLVWGYDLYRDFLQYIIYNIKNMKYNVDTYYEVVMRTKELYYDTYEIKRYISLSQTLYEMIKVYNKELSSLDSKNFTNEVDYNNAKNKISKYIDATQELYSISLSLTNDKVYGYNKDFMVVNSPILEEKDFCTNNLLVEPNVAAVDFYRIVNNNTLQFIKSIKKNNFSYYNEKYFICNFNDKPNCDYYAYAVNEYNFRSPRITFHTLTDKEKAEALSKKYENEEYINYALKRTEYNTDLSYYDYELDNETKNRLLTELSKDDINTTLQVPIINNIEDDYIEILFTDYALIKNSTKELRLVLSEVDESLIDTTKYKYKIEDSNMFIYSKDSCLKYDNSYLVYIEDEEGNQLSKTVSFVFNKEHNDLDISSYYTNSYLNQLKEELQYNNLLNVNLSNIINLELSNYNNAKFNILNNILENIIANNNVIPNYSAVLDVFFNYYFSDFNVQDLSNYYTVSYSEKTKKINIDLKNAYCLVYEIANNINKSIITTSDCLLLDSNKVYVFYFAKEDCSEISNFLLIDTIKNKIFNNIMIELEEER